MPSRLYVLLPTKAEDDDVDVGKFEKFLALSLFALLLSTPSAFAEEHAPASTACAHLTKIAAADLPRLPIPRDINLLEIPTPIPGVQDAVVAAIMRNGRLLMGQRGGEIGYGSWGVLGGKLDPGEALLSGLIRELNEEIGLNRLVSASVVYTHYHYAAEKDRWFRVFVVKAAIDDWDAPEIQSPREILNLQWFALDNLPRAIFSHLYEYLDTLRGSVR